MKIIDAHCHLSNVDSFHEAACDISGVTYTPEGYRAGYVEVRRQLGWELEAAAVIGLTETTGGAFPDRQAPNPMLPDRLPESLAGTPFYPVLGINPCRIGEPRELERLTAAVQGPRVIALKIYAGYYHFHIHDPVYDPVYDLAEEAGLPVIIHMGDTYSEKALLKYSHPLNADELAVSRRGINFVVCHMAEPWAMTAAELVLKNRNIYLDCSGIFVGDDAYVRRMTGDALYMDRLRGALSYMEDYGRLLYGTDWPLTPILPYVEFVRALVPEEHWQAVFHDNAARLFRFGVDEGFSAE